MDRRTLEHFMQNGSTPRGGRDDEGRAGRSARILAALACAAFAFVLYAPSLDDYFLGDDFDLILSIYGKPLSYYVALLYSNESGDVWRGWGIDPGAGFGYLRPLKMWLLGWDSVAWGANPFGFHLTANLLFALDIAVVFLLLDLLLPGRRVLALVGAAVTAMHPVFAEIVPFVTAREETLALLLVLAAFVAFLRFREHGASPLVFHVFFALGLLSKESAIVTAGLVAGWDFVHGKLSLRAPALRRDALRLYLPMLATLAIYLSLRWIAFGNPKGGDGSETHYLSIDAFLGFHRRFFASLVGEHSFAFSEIAGVGWMVVALLVAALATIALRGTQRRRWQDLLFYGPVWYLVSMSVYYGTYFTNRHHPGLVVGLVAFATLLLSEVTRGVGRLREGAVALAALGVCALALLPPTFAMRDHFGRASEKVRVVRAQIEAATAHVPDGSRVLVTNVPAGAAPPWYFGWGLLSALKKPFTESDLANRAVVVNPKQRYMTRDPDEPPERFDLHVKIDP